MRVGVFPKLSCLATYYLLLITYIYLYYITCLFFQKQRNVRNV